MIHLHHILPKHAGGTDEESNLFPLNVTQHALAHRNRWILTGDIEDKIAWLCLNKQIGSEEAYRLAQIEGAKKMRGIPKSAIAKKRMSKPRSERGKENIRKAIKLRNYFGENNPRYQDNRNWEELLGKDKAEKLKLNLRICNGGSNNAMFGVRREDLRLRNLTNNPGKNPEVQRKANKVKSELRNLRIEEYNLNPRSCLECLTPISYNRRNKFCNSSCFGKWNIKQRMAQSV